MHPTTASTVNGPSEVEHVPTCLIPELVLLTRQGPATFDVSSRELSGHDRGGLVTALSGLLRHSVRNTWVCVARTAMEHAFARQGESVAVELSPGVTCDVRFVTMSADRQRLLHAAVADPILWSLQHHLWDLKSEPDITEHEHNAWRAGYVPANDDFAREVMRVARGTSHDAVLMVHDHHFYLVPGRLRALGVRRFIAHFVHIPWPGPEAWHVLPARWRRSILNGILGADLVSFHTERDARNFIATCSDALGVHADLPGLTVRYAGRDVAVRFHPASVDARAIEVIAEEPDTARCELELLAQRKESLIVRVDRVDPAQNVVRGFMSYARLLELHPELRGHVTFLALLLPSRQGAHEDRRYRAQIEASVERVNARFGTSEWLPIALRIEDNLPLAVAGYKQFDVLLVNSFAGGMNLAAKEAVLANTRDGVLALSENTDAHAEFGSVAVTVHPFDIEQQARALWEAVTMSAADRRVRCRLGRDIARRNDAADWLARQLADVRALRA